jgi:hypothetical protein
MRLFNIGLITALITTVTLANSAMVFPQRAILDSQNRTANFKVINPSSRTSQYKIDIIDRIQNNEGRTETVDIYEFSAKQNIVYSPRKTIKLEENEKKPIRIKLKKYADLADGEYRSYLNIVTDNADKSKPEGYAVAVRTGIQLPVIIRKGNLTATASLASAKLDSGKVAVTLHREGTRSIFGDIIIRQNGVIIGESKSVAVYVESNNAMYKVNTKDINPLQPISVTFTEEENSGEIEIEKDFTL